MRRTARRAFTLVGALLLVMAMALPASAKIEFHRIVYDPSGVDTGSNSHLNRESVVLHNTAQGPDGSATGGSATWPGTCTRCRTGFGSVLTGTSACTPGRGSNDSNDLYWGSGWYVWNNTGDRATFKNAAGTVIDGAGTPGAAR